MDDARGDSLRLLEGEAVRHCAFCRPCCGIVHGDKANWCTLTLSIMMLGELANGLRERSGDYFLRAADYDDRRTRLLREGRGG